MEILCSRVRKRFSVFVGTTSMFFSQLYLLHFYFQDISEDDDLDWWSKYFGSKNEDDDEIKKCGSFLEKGHKAIQVTKF